MTKTLSLTEFNQNPSQATRLADVDEVIVLRRGAAAYRLTRIEHPDDPVDALVQMGLATPARRTSRNAPGRRRFRHVTTSEDAAAMLDADRNRLEF